MSGLSRSPRAQGRAAQRIADGGEQFLPIERLLEQTVVTSPVEWRPIQQLRATGDQDDWQPGPRGLNSLYQFETVHDRHADVRDQAVNVRKTTTLQQRRRRRKQAH